MIREQFHRPTGLLGRLAGQWLAHRSSNVARNRWAVGLLEVKPTDRCLELGFGPGVAIEELAAAATDGQVFGLDHSEVMVEMATDRNRAAVDAGRVELRLGDARQQPLPFGDLDVVLAVNCSIFWDDQGEVLDRLRAAMRPGGRLALVVEPRFRGATDADALRIAEANAALLGAAGFVDTRVETLALRPVDAGAAIGINP
jgi:SAM-dependent methyltransferase